MIRRARKLNPDILYAVPFPTATPYYAWQTARQLGCPWVIQPHIHEAQMNASLLKILKWLFPQASAVLTNTEPEKKFLVSQGIEASKIQVFGQGLSAAALIPGDGRAFRRRQGWTDEPLIVFLGRKVEGKGIETLLAAMPQVWAEAPRAVLLLAGQTSPYFKDLLDRLPVGRDARLRSLDNFPEEGKDRPPGGRRPPGPTLRGGKLRGGFSGSLGPKKTGHRGGYPGRGGHGGRRKRRVPWCLTTIRRPWPKPSSSC